jgi:hypothetical protein
VPKTSSYIIQGLKCIVVESLSLVNYALKEEAKEVTTTIIDTRIKERDS